MSKIPCRKCKKCGLYNDLSVEVCRCGHIYETKAATLLETENLSSEERGTIDEALVFYVQLCSACHTMNFTLDANKRAEKCVTCGKPRIKKVEPERYVEKVEETPSEQETSPDTSCAKVMFGSDDDPAQWSRLRGEIESSAKGMNGEAEKEEKDEINWDDLLYKETTDTEKVCITLQFTGNANEIFTVTPEQQPYLLGRHGEKGFLFPNDLSVSKKHCYLTFENGSWYVTDNNAANGTLVNWIDIGLGGKQKLNTSDVIILGHESHSPSFRITIG